MVGFRWSWVLTRSKDAAHAPVVGGADTALSLTDSKSLSVSFLAELELGISGQQMIEMHQVLNEKQLLASRLIPRIKLHSLLKLVPGALIFAS